MIQFNFSRISDIFQHVYAKLHVNLDISSQEKIMKPLCQFFLPHVHGLHMLQVLPTHQYVTRFAKVSDKPKDIG